MIFFNGRPACRWTHVHNWISVSLMIPVYNVSSSVDTNTLYDTYLENYHTYCMHCIAPILKHKKNHSTKQWEKIFSCRATIQDQPRLNKAILFVFLLLLFLFLLLAFRLQKPEWDFWPFRYILSFLGFRIPVWIFPPFWSSLDLSEIVETLLWSLRPFSIFFYLFKRLICANVYMSKINLHQ